MLFNMSHSMTKPTKWPLRPAKTQVSLGIHLVWSESSVCTQWVAKDKLSSCGQRRLIRLSRCIGWSEFSLGTHIVLLVLSCWGSYIHTDLEDGIMSLGWADFIRSHETWASSVIRWYQLIQETWYRPSDQVPTVIMFLLYIFFCLFFT